MKCRHCGQEEAIKNSHIIPEWMYQDAYNDRGQLVPIMMDNRGKVEVMQKGIREELLCPKCEVYLSVLEGYAKGFLVSVNSGKNPKVTLEPYSDRTNRISGFDFQKVKKFILSLFYRASISKHPAFKSYDLGPYLHDIEDLVFNEAECTEQGFPVSITKMLVGPHETGLVMMTPPHKVEGKTFYSIYGFGFGFNLLVDADYHGSFSSVFIKQDHMYIQKRNLNDEDLSERFLRRMLEDDVQRFYRRKSG